MWRDRIESQPMFNVLRMANERAAQGNYVARMEIGDTPGFKNINIHNLIAKYAHSNFRYSPSQGEQVLRESVTLSQWPDKSPENIVIGPANFLITAALASCTGENDSILLPDPGFPTYRLAANFLGLRIVYYPVYGVGTMGFPDLDAFVKDLKIRPKAIVVNNPSNPLGIAFPGHDISHSLRNFESLGISVILDETYVNLVYDNTNPLVTGIPATRIRTFSKEHCAPGLRVGYILSDSQSTKTIADFMSLSISCVPQFIQFAIAEYLNSSESSIFVETLRIEMKKRFNFLTNSLPSNTLKRKPNSAFYALLSVGNSQECFDFLLKRNIATCPGKTFGNNSWDSIRVSLAGDAVNIKRDLRMLSDALCEWLSSNQS